MARSSLKENVARTLAFDMGSDHPAVLQYYSIAKKVVDCLFSPEEDEDDDGYNSLGYHALEKDIAKMIAKRSRGVKVDLSDLVDDVCAYLENVALLREHDRSSRRRRTRNRDEN